MTTANRALSGFMCLAALVAVTAVFQPASVLAAPNLQVVKLLTSSGTVGIGQPLTAHFQIQNLGDTDSGPCKLGIYYSNDISITTTDPLLTSVDLPAIPASTTHDEMVADVTLPADAALGTRYVGAIVDFDNQVVETSDVDNARSATITVVDPPDLRFTTVSVNPTSAHSGDTVEISYKVINAGASPANDFKTRLYFSDNNVIDTQDSELPHERTTSLANGADTGLIVAQVALPLGLPTGTRYVGGIADVDNTIFEHQETNNTTLAPITILEVQCFDTAASNPDVCGSRGVCVGTDICECDDGYGGQQCLIECPDQCVGCVSSEECDECDDGWQGTDCLTPICSPECGQNAECTAPNECTCDAGFEGDGYTCVSGDTGGGCSQSGLNVAALPGLAIVVALFLMCIFRQRRRADA
ncbi:MAG TPA: CARDB domain-containing protein [Myxococcota bacterium]|nr:CARDB domain-containing protein [Myxococcota bacterium]